MLKIEKSRDSWCYSRSVRGGLLAGLMTVLLPVLPSQAGNDYQICTAKLKSAKVEDAIAAKVCAEALHPQDVGRCVERIILKKLEVDPTVEACRRVRRPLELAECVTDIAQQDAKSPLAEVLDHCRRSLLPERFGECVVGLNQQPLKVNVPEALGICIDASDRPKDLQLIPLDQVIAPSAPSPRTEMPPMPPSSTPTPTPTPTPQLF
jgi:hypothetical protein